MQYKYNSHIAQIKPNIYIHFCVMCQYTKKVLYIIIL
nr:MAG TPA: Selenoprotein W, thioredoxin-like fold, OXIDOREDUCTASE [Caudoviricetes sp.]